MQIEKEKFKLEQRRYLGSKQKLLPFIAQVINEHTQNVQSLADIFAGTGVVANYFAKQGKQIIVNDILQANHMIYQAWFGEQEVEQTKLEKLIAELNALPAEQENYVSQNFGDKYFSLANARKIGAIREHIETLEVNAREKAVLLTSLLYAMDRVANTVGHYDAYRKKMDSWQALHLRMPELLEQPQAQIYCEDANSLVQKIQADLVYIDTPYNSRQYGDAYHLLENIITWQKPQVEGVARKMVDRQATKSKYSTKAAPQAFAELIKHIDAKYILVSYSNMAQKGDGRSNAKISAQEIIATLATRGKVEVFSQAFKAFTTGKSQIDDHQELLYLCTVEAKEENAGVETSSLDLTTETKVTAQEELVAVAKAVEVATASEATKDSEPTKEPEPEKTSEAPNVPEPTKAREATPPEYIASPINYSGGKYKLLKQILPLFPKQIRHFYDVFAGGANVAVNVDAEQTIICDREQEVMKLFAYMQEHDLETMLKQIEELIATYELSNTKVKGYDFYQANSSAGLKEVNQQAYLQLRADYNQGKFKADPELVFYVLLVYAFNNQIRFNAKGLFNMPPGKRDFNVQMEKKFKLFKQALDNKQLQIKCQDGIALLEQIDNPQDFVYLDPPYLISTASYNEGQGWTIENELALLAALDELHACGVKFALSNVLAHKGKENTHLQQWAQKYKIHYLEHHYNNSNYQSQAGKHQTIEVLITNY